ncbi:Ig-like domain repeat protein [Methanobrevibacter sp.]|uniref:Ig-like domain repeat protein n=1 Tax=Methanobrevibacter sp. TaxID=66852 RepID=UPI00389106EC
MKKKIFISMLILLLISISAVSASDDLDQNITQTNDIGTINDDVLSASSAKTFTDLQTQIGRTSAGSTLTLEDDYAYTEGTDRTIGIAIYGTTKDITIDGNGHTLDGKNVARIIYINEGANNITIKNVNFVNGYQDSGAGAIFWKGESGTIINCNFTSDTADKSGGAIIWTGAEGTIDNCKFEKCSSKSQSGGALYTTDACDKITISNSKFISNKAKTSGAAIASAGAGAVISKNIFTDNSASDSGAAIYLSGANTKISECQFIANKVEGSGGAIFWKGELGTLDKSNFTANTAKDNGGAVFWATAKGTITNNRFENSVSNTQSGGAIYCNDLSAQTTLSNNVFINNTAQTCGAGIGSAGANSIISNNIFTDNIVHESGAGLYTSGKGSKINNNQFLRNKAVSGGAVYIEIDGISMDKCYFKDNYITGGGGGAMRWNGNSGTMTNCVFEDNIAETRGGAVYWNGNDAKIQNSNFTNNVAITAAGGALIYSGNNGQIISNNFNENSATQGYGGALYVGGNSNKINSNKFDKNTAAKGGGAIYYDGTSGSVTGNTITSNSAENACGIRWNGDGATITSNTFKGNKNTNGANIIFGDGAKAKVTQNTFLNNKESDNCIRWNSADAVITPNTYKDDTVTKLTGSEVTAYYGDSANLIFTLTTSTQALPGKTVTISFNNKNTDVTTNANGQAILDVKGTGVGTCPVSAKFAGDSDYDASSAAVYLYINKAPTEVVLTGIKDIIIGQELEMTATVNATGGSVTFDVNGNKTTVPLSTGKAVYTFKPALGDQTYTVNATYNPSDNYLTSSASATFKVTKMPTSISGENVTAYLGGKGQLIFTLTDETTSKGMPQTEVNVTFYGQTYTQSTDREGKITLDLANLGIGTYDAFVSYAGDDIFAPSNATATAFVKSTIESEDLIANYGDATYTARFVDIDGKALSEGTTVSFSIDNAPYRVPVDKNGIATLTIDKTPGNYTITNINTMTGEQSANNITINKMPTETTITGLKDINVGENLTATIKVNASNGTLTTKFNGESQLVNYTGGDYNIHFDGLDEGTYTLTATFEPENQYFEGSSAEVTFKVTKKANIITVETKDIEEGEDAVFDVSASIKTSEATLNINGKKYTQNLTDGKASFTVSNLTANTYKYTVSVEGDKYYEANSTEGTISVKSTKIIISAPDLEKYYGDTKRFVVTVTDKDNKPLKDIAITIIINGVAYDKTTNENGTTSIGINLPANNYTAEIIFKGNEDYRAVNATSNIKIKTTILGSDVVKIEKSPEQYVATFLDSTGKYLPAGEHMLFNINGVLYDRITRENGQARLNLNLEAKTYVITAYNTITGEQSANNITIKPRIVNNSDITKYFRNATQYEVTLLDDNGNPVKAGETVTFNINGVFYDRKTNDQGVAKLNINLEPKTYVITAIYKNCVVANTIKVLPVLSAKDLTMKYRDGSKFEAKLVDGQGRPYANQNITFNVNGVFYNRITDETGTARLNINLMAGKYIITSSYNGSNIANTITINL